MTVDYVVITRAGYSATYRRHTSSPYATSTREAGDIGATEGNNVIAYWYEGGADTKAYVTIKEPSCSGVTGRNAGKTVEIRFMAQTTPTPTQIGRVQYVHIEPSVTDGQEIASNTNVVIGTIGGYGDGYEADPDPLDPDYITACWTAPHLHQDQFHDRPADGQLIPLASDGASLTAGSTFVCYLDVQL